MKRVVFDAFAVIAWLEGEREAEFVAALMREVQTGRTWGGVCAMNLGEVYYTTARRHGQGRADAYLHYLTALPWVLIPASNDLTWRAARLKAAHRISYADAFALACAIEREAALVTGDPELHAATHGVELLWDAREDKPSPE